MRWFLRLSVLTLTMSLFLAPAWALMPPHVDGTNITGGVLEGTTLIVRGYSLEFSELPKDLLITHTEDGRSVVWKHQVECTQEGDCTGDAPPGACQLRCVLTVTLSGLKDGDRLQVKYLDLNTTFEVKLKK